MQIKQIVLYSRWGGKRVIDLRLGDLNIITGKSKTGKSAIGRIIEYVLGSDSFGVFIGAIRNTVSWYALVLTIGDTEVFLARPDPEPHETTGDMYLEVGSPVRTPTADALVANTNADAVRHRLARMIGIAPNLYEPPPGQTGRPLEASLSHALLYCFQNQNVVGNLDVLFHKQNEEFVPQAIRDTFPYFLGSVGNDRLDKIIRLRQVRRDLRLLESDAAELESLRSHRSTVLKGLCDEAKDVGLISDYSDENALERMQAIARNPRPDDVTLLTDDPTADLRAERNALVTKFRDIQDGLRVARRYRDEQGGFTSEARQQILRLKSVELFGDIDDHSCPICGHALDAQHTTAVHLIDSIKRLDQQIASAVQEEPRLLEYIERLRAESNKISLEVAALDTRIQSLTEQQQAVRQRYEREQAKGRTIGRISMFLESLSDAAQTSTASGANRLAELKSEATQLAAELDEEVLKERINSMMSNLGRQIAEMSDRFELEHRGFAIRLDLRQLTLVIDQGNRTVPLSQVGAGENWVGYHLAFFLALHSWFRNLDRPVPAFLFIDQPTQAYFPPDSDSSGALDELAGDDDRQAVRRMFEIMIAVATELAPRFQIIVTDHADLSEDWFRNRVVQRWRGPNALIPHEWIAKADAAAS